jgi:hypothetical protein
MRRSAQGLTAALLLGGLTTVLQAALPVRPASGDDTIKLTPKVVQSNWYWYHQADAAAGTGVEAAPEPSGVPKGDVSVAYTGGTQDDPDQPSKETYLAFDLTGLTAGASITGFSFTIPLDGQAQAKATPPVLQACLPTRTWSNGAGNNWVEKPGDDCSTAMAAQGKYDMATNSYTFVIPSIAQNWLTDVNTGVAIRHAAPEAPAQSPTGQAPPLAPFQLNFSDATSVKASVSYLPAVPTTAEPPAAAPAPVPGVPADTTSGSGAIGGGSGGGVATSPTTQTPSAPGPAVAPNPQLAPKPVAAGRAFGPASAAPSAGFLLVAVALAVLLGLISLVVGDVTGATPASVSPARRSSRLDQALRARRTPLSLESR